MAINFKHHKKTPQSASHRKCIGCGKTFVKTEMFLNVTHNKYTNRCIPCAAEARKKVQKNYRENKKAELSIDNKQITHGIWPMEKAMATYKRERGILPAIKPGTSLRKREIRTGIW